MSQKDSSGEETTVDGFTELGQLVKSTLHTVDELFPPKPEFSFEDMMIQFYTLKNKIKKIDSNWKFENTDISYMFEILKLLDTINIEEKWDSKSNKEWFHEMIKSMNTLKDLHPQWHLTKQDVDRYNTTCPCSQCSTEEGKEDTISSSISKLNI